MTNTTAMEKSYRILKNNQAHETNQDGYDKNIRGDD